nr:hypothetical protein CFP56_13420 [Quercus suber]
MYAQAWEKTRGASHKLIVLPNCAPPGKQGPERLWCWKPAGVVPRNLFLHLCRSTTAISGVECQHSAGDNTAKRKVFAGAEVGHSSIDMYLWNDHAKLTIDLARVLTSTAPTPPEEQMRVSAARSSGSPPIATFVPGDDPDLRSGAIDNVVTPRNGRSAMHVDVIRLGSRSVPQQCRRVGAWR